MPKVLIDYSKLDFAEAGYSPGERGDRAIELDVAIEPGLPVLKVARNLIGLPVRDIRAQEDVQVSRSAATDSGH